MRRKQDNVIIDPACLEDAGKRIISFFDDRKIQFVLREHVIAFDKAVYSLDRKKEAVRRLRVFLDYLDKVLIPHPNSVKETIGHLDMYEIFSYYQKIDGKIRKLKKIGNRNKRKEELNKLLENEGLKLNPKIYEHALNNLTAERWIATCSIVGKKFMKSKDTIRKIVAKMTKDENGILHIKKRKKKR